MADRGDGIASDDVLGAVRAQRAGLRSAMVALEAAISAPGPGRPSAWWEGVERALAGVERVFAAHVEVTEGAGGLFEQVVDQAPRLAHAVGRLRQEHAAIRDGLRALTDRPAPAASADASEEVERVREEALGLLGQLSRHRQRGADLLHEAFVVDVSVGD